MVDYSLRFNETPRDQILTMLRWAGERNDAKAKERKDEYMKLMQMLGRGYGAYKANRDYNDWKADQESWNDEYGQLEDMENLPYTPVENMPFMNSTLCNLSCHLSNGLLNDLQLLNMHPISTTLDTSHLDMF